MALLEVALEAARGKNTEAKLLHVAELLADQKNPFCVQCSDPCQGKCAEGTKLGEAFRLLRKADGILVASPVYFGTVSGQLKAFWDKGRSLRRERALLNVVGGALVVGGARFGGQETTLRALHDMMLVQGMTVVGDGGEEDCGHQGACAQRPVQEDQLALQRARILARRVVAVAEATMPLRRCRGE